jgi:SH3-like domain-containing protein
LDPDNKWAYLSRAWAYLMLGDDQAHRDFLQWIDLNQTEEFTYTLEDAPVGPLPFTEGTVYRFTFDALAGQALNVAAKVRIDEDVDPLLVLLNPDGVAIMSDDDSGVNLTAVIVDFIIPADDTYTLVLSHASYGTEGAVLLSVNLDGVVVMTSDDVAAEFVVYNLFIHEVAEVYTTDDTVLNLRSGPGLDFEIVQTLERGELVNLVEGPHKADGYAWWRIRTAEGVVGWAVERVGEEQTLQLALIVGQEAIVTTGEDTLNMRGEPSTGADIVSQLIDGEPVTLLEVPQLVAGYRWWHVRTESNQEGWVVDRVAGERMLIPARERE